MSKQTKYIQKTVNIDINTSLGKLISSPDFEVNFTQLVTKLLNEHFNLKQ